MWVLAAEGRTVQRRSVRKGRFSGVSIEVPEGLHAGDRVVTRGSAYLADGMQVRAKPVEELR